MVFKNKKQQVEVIKTFTPTNEKPKGLVEAFLSGLSESKDVREQAYVKLVDYLFDERKLLMTSRLNDDKAENILKHKIFVDFFQNYYSSCKVKITLNEIKNNDKQICMCQNPEFNIQDCKFCNNTGKYKENFIDYKRYEDYEIITENIREKFLKMYPDLIDNLCMITISWGGMGRKEILSVLRATENEMDKKEQMKAWLRDRLQ